MRGSASRQPRISCGESMPLRAGWLARNSASWTRRCATAGRQEVHTRDGQCLVGRRRCAGIRDDAVEGVFELLEHGHLVASRWTKTVPCSAPGMFHSNPWNQGVADLGAGGDDVRVHLVDADLRVRDAAVVGDDHPIQTVRVGVSYLVDHPILRVAACTACGCDGRRPTTVGRWSASGLHAIVRAARGVGGRNARERRDARRDRGGARAGQTGPP